MSHLITRKITDSAHIYEDFDTRFYEWEDGMSSAGLKLELSRQAFTGFDWEVTGYNFGRLVGGILNVSEHDIHRQRGNIFSMPDHVLIFIMVLGGMECRCFGRRFSVQQGDILIQDSSQPIAIHVHPSSSPPHLCTYQYIILPKHTVALSLDIAALHGRVLPAASPMSFLLRQHFNGMLQVFDTLSEPEVLATGEGAAALILHTLSLVAGVPVEAPFAHSSRLEQVCLYIEQHLAQPLTAEMLCRQFGLSRAALYRLFEPMGGIALFIRNRRATLARRLMRTTSLSDLSLTAIARRCGLSPATLRRLLVQEYGMSSRDVRTALLNAPPPAAGTPTHLNWVSHL
ncbi:AraC family transcriptional regulator [Chimaeribacter coloradensis]|uniref:AraC family transcriptional regulator n=1 Tax=Chimaeribacter coloradensis TaxID=2060068 RepID=A0A2N5EDH2_9GAMM|nr:AraC family transcriptional regulator [Chimaeribacter coloradensis]PLR40578.1 AraC family transcriptional regulator [Chimaeribacter coloradensis]